MERAFPKRNKPDFPQRPVANPERRKQKIKERADDAPVKTYENRGRSVRVSRSNIDPRSALRSLYTNENDELICQICCEGMPFRDRSGQYYFEAVELFTSEIVGKEHDSMYIYLCPTCAAKYKEFVKSDSKAMKSLLRNIQHA